MKFRPIKQLNFDLRNKINIFKNNNNLLLFLLKCIEKAVQKCQKDRRLLAAIVIQYSLLRFSYP